MPGTTRERPFRYQVCCGRARTSPARPNRCHRHDHGRSAVSATGPRTDLADLGGRYRPIPGLADRANQAVLVANMNEARSRQTATLLPDGRVLVAGGRDASGLSLSSAEVHDPANNTWTLTGSLATPRDWHRTVLREDAMVLVAGGLNTSAAGNPVLRSAELYDPASGTWRPTGNMVNPRWGFTATQLQDGRVLAAGGGTEGTESVPRATSETYDPSTGTWSQVGDLNLARSFGVATCLAAGGVLVAGGFCLPGTSSPVTATPEVFDPSTGMWHSTGSMTVPRAAMAFSHAAAPLPDGRVLVAGGNSVQNDQTQSSAELYDPGNGMWSAAGSLAFPRSGYAQATLQDGRILVVGGVALPTRTRYASAELCNP